MQTQTEKQMKVLLTKNYIYIDTFRGYKSDYQKYLDFKKWILENQGKWIDIDTSCIFEDQSLLWIHGAR